MSKKSDKHIGTYIDLFSGCGGLSLGLGNAGWKGLFAIEKDAMAFETFKHNMIDGDYAHFEWPSWLPQKETTIQKLLKTHRGELKRLSGSVDLIAGGPPCQGFSLAGMRDAKDSRNKLSREYIKMVEIIRPKYILLENVRGFNSSFKSDVKSKKVPYSEIVKKAIEKLGYKVTTTFLNSADFGVPQSRVRFIMMGIRDDLPEIDQSPFEELTLFRNEFLKGKGLPDRHISVKEAISDLEIYKKGAKLVSHSGSEKSGFKKLDFSPPKRPTSYQRLMSNQLGNIKPNSLRIARHKPSTIEKFKLIQKICRPGHSLSDDEKELVGTKKQSICVLNEKKPSRTLTTLPDDILHYSEPRILTVRESARIQSFPDSFKFRGKYTTGGQVRTKECPRYTQVGNAVPPLMAEALGLLVKGVSEGNKNG